MAERSEVKKALVAADHSAHGRLRQTGVGPGRRRYRRIVLVACALAFLAVLVHATVAFWAHSEFTQPEGIIATQTLSFAREASLYHDLQQYS
jgi:hypothetical protein